MELRQAIELICNAFAFFGITVLNPETLRLAAVGKENHVVSEKLWRAMMKLIVLHLSGFQGKLAPNEEASADLNTVQSLVTYVLQKWSCPVPLLTPRDLLFALGFTLGKVDLFKHYDLQTRRSHHLLFTSEVLSEGLQQHIETNDRPEFRSPSHLSVLSLYNTIQKHIHFALERAKHCFHLIDLVREHCGAEVEPEDLLVTQTEEQVRVYETTQEAYLRSLEKHQAEVEARRMFWDWLAKVLEDSEPQESEVLQTPSPTPPDVSFAEIMRKTPQLLAEVEIYWKKLSPFIPKAKGKWKEVRSVLSQTTDPQTFKQYEAQLEEVRERLTNQFLTLEMMIEQTISAGEIPPLFPIEVPTIADRSEGEEEILAHLPQLEQDLARMKQRCEEELLSRLQNNMDVRTWVTSVLVKAENYDAEGLNALLFQQTLKQPSHPDTRRLISDSLPPSKSSAEAWVNFLSAHSEFLLAQRPKFELLSASQAAFSQLFQEGLQGAWALPVVYRFSKKVSALLASTASGKTNKRVEQAINELQKLLGICQKTAERPPDSKLMGLVGVMNMLFRLYFRINNTQLCVNLLKIVNSPHSRLPNLKYFPRSQQVEFKYYEGRLCVYEQQIVQAEECLEFSFVHSHPSSIRNKRIILQYLIPVKVARGKFPTRNLLTKYAQGDYLPILEAIRQGNVGVFQAELVRNQDNFVKTGIYIMMESLLLMVYRNLFCKTYKILNLSQIPLQKFLIAANSVATSPLDLDELECLFVNLIAKGWVKGYLSYEHKVVVLSKKTPAFPKIRDIS